ncbi:hypothetical protein V2G26_012217 [Clonostachys chloroleuca]
MLTFLCSWVVTKSSPLCQSDPVVVLHAGKTVISTTIANPPPRRCQATLSFKDPSLLPVRFTFSPLPCGGQLVASFVVPVGVPNGPSELSWQCSGFDPSCNSVVITGSSLDPDTGIEYKGLLECQSGSWSSSQTPAITWSPETRIGTTTIPSLITTPSSASTVLATPTRTPALATSQDSYTTLTTRAKISETTVPFTSTKASTNLILETSSALVTQSDQSLSTLKGLPSTSSSDSHTFTSKPEEQISTSTPESIFQSTASRTDHSVARAIVTTLMSTVVIMQTVTVPYTTMTTTATN